MNALLQVLAMSLSAMSSIGYYSPSLMDAAADYFVVSMPSLKFQVDMTAFT